MKAVHRLTCLATLALTACSRPAPVPLATVGPGAPVRIAIVAIEQVPLLVESPATVRPTDRASISARLTGTIASFPPGLGEAVAAGDILLTLQVPEVEARLCQAQAQLAEADRNANRQRTLVASGVNPVDAQRDAEDRLRFARAAAAEAEAQLSYATVRAPFAGVITAKNALPGDLAAPGIPLLILESTTRLRAEGTVPERAAASLHPGDPVEVVLENSPAPVSGKLEEISAAADPVSRSVSVKIALPPGTARSGQFARLQINVGSAGSIFVPATAVTRFGQMERLFVVEQDRCVLRLVKTGRAMGGRVEILSGLNPGEQIVLAPAASLHDGQTVAVQP